MNEELKEIIVRLYGKQCSPYIEEINRRISLSLTSLLYAGDQGDNPLCILNKTFNNIKSIK
jgi:hypothetical protein